MLAPATFTSNTDCETCSPDKYQDEKDHFENACKSQPTCAPGTYASVPATVFIRRVCRNCDLGLSFSTEENAASCTPVSGCAAGTRQSQAPTRTSDRTCTGCIAGQTYMDEEDHSFDTCKAVGPVCEAGLYQAAAPTVTSDRECVECPPGFFSPIEDSILCYPCQLGSSQPESGSRSCRSCDPAAGQFSNVTGAIQCSAVREACEEDALEITATAARDRRCIATFERTTVASVGHYSYMGSGGETIGVDYLASPKASLGGAALPDTLTLPRAGGEVAVAVAAADTFKVRLVLDSGMQAQLQVDVAYCGMLAGAAGPLASTPLELEPLMVDGFTINTEVTFRSVSGALEAMADGTHCVMLSAASLPRTSGWTMDQLVLRVGGLPALAETGTLQLTRLSVIKVTTTSVIAGSGDPGQRLLVRDQEAPQFVLCPAPLQALVAAGQESTTVTWQVPQATDNSGSAFVDEGIIFGFDGQEEDIAASVSAGGSDASAQLSLLRAPYRVAYTAVDSAGNSAECSFEVALDYVASSDMVRAELGAGDIVPSVEATRAGTLLRSTLVDARRGAAAVSACAARADAA